MSGISIQIGLRDLGASSQLQELLDRLDRRQPFFAAVGDRFLKGASDNFRGEHDPNGAKWTPLRPATIKARIRKRQTPITILRSNASGKNSSLAGSLNRIATNDDVRIGSPLPYAAIHQLGGTIEKKERAGKIYRSKNADGSVGRRFAKKSRADVETDVTIRAHKIVIPARPYLGMSKDDELAIGELADDWLMG